MSSSPVRAIASASTTSPPRAASTATPRPDSPVAAGPIDGDQRGGRSAGEITIGAYRGRRLVAAGSTAEATRGLSGSGRAPELFESGRRSVPIDRRRPAQRGPLRGGRSLSRRAGGGRRTASEQHQGAPPPERQPDGAPPDTEDEHRARLSSAVPPPTELYCPRPRALHAGPGVEPGSDDELDAGVVGPFLTHRDEPTTSVPRARARAPRADPEPHACARADAAPHPFYTRFSRTSPRTCSCRSLAASGHSVAPASRHPQRRRRVDADGTLNGQTARVKRSGRLVAGRRARPRASARSPRRRCFDDVPTEN